jgi:hypothetical protein
MAGGPICIVLFVYGIPIYGMMPYFDICLSRVGLTIRSRSCLDIRGSCTLFLRLVKDLVRPKALGTNPTYFFLMLHYTGADWRLVYVMITMIPVLTFALMPAKPCRLDGSMFDKKALQLAEQSCCS